HLVGTYDGNIARFYVNGGLEATASTTRVINSTAPLRIGRLNSNNEPFQGLIDEVTVYGRPLAASEIQGIYAADSAGKSSNDLSNRANGVLIQNTAKNNRVGTNGDNSADAAERN